MSGREVYGIQLPSGNAEMFVADMPTRAGRGINLSAGGSNGNRELIGRSAFVKGVTEGVSHSAFTIRRGGFVDWTGGRQE